MAAENILKPQRKGFRKVSAETAAAIRREYTSGYVTQFELATKYGTSTVTVRNILRGKHWSLREEEP